MTRKLFSLLLLAGFRVWSEDLTGNYGLVGEREAASQLTLKDDGSFEYGLTYGATDYWGKGTWRHEEGAVILNSTGSQDPPFRLAWSEAGKKDGIRVWVKAANGYGVENITVVLHTDSGDIERNTSREGLAEFPAVKGRRDVSLRVPAYQVDMGPMRISPVYNNFIFEINGKAITEFRFQNQRVAIDGDTLELQVGRYIKQ